jgi:hypothetical protein
LKSLYTILLGNPELDAKGLSGAPTRFKKWWHLVGSAVEHAACSMAEKRGKAFLFKQMFERIEASDEEAIERADIIQSLYAIFNKQKFSALAVFEHLAKSARDAADGTSERPGSATLRRFCTPRIVKSPSPRSIGHALQGIVDAPVAVLAETYALRSGIDGHSNCRKFQVCQPGDEGWNIS